MADLICPACTLWTFLPEDRFCGHCGLRLSGLSAEFDPEVWIVGTNGERRTGEATVKLVLTNQGQVGLKRVSVKPLDPSVVQINADYFDGGVLVEPLLGRHSIGLPLTLQLGDVGTLPRRLAIQVSAEGIEPDTVTLDLVPPPEVQFDLPDPLSLLLLGETQRLSGSVKLAAGRITVAAITATITDLPDAVAVELSAPLPIDLLAKQHSDLTLTLAFDVKRLETVPVERLRDGLKLTLTVEADVPGAGPAGETERRSFPHEATLRAIVPPRIGVKELGSGSDNVVLPVAVLLGRPAEADATVTVENRGGQPLRVERIEPSVPWLSVSEGDAPFTLDPDERRTVKLRVDRAELPLDDGETSGKFSAALEITAAAPARPLRIALLIRAETPGVLEDGMIAVDFGTVNTCCALTLPSDPKKGGGTRIVQVKLKGTPHLDDSIPSLVAYLRLIERGATPEADRKITAVGQLAESYWASPAATSIQYAIKRKLGNPKPEEVLFAADGERRRYPAELIAADILRPMLDAVEQQFKIRVRSVIATHPARFTRVQKEALRRAYDLCGVTVAGFLDEPVGAALSYVQSRMQLRAAALRRGEADSYTMLVYDCGGGTTDLTVIRVETTHLDGHTTIVPTVLGTSGAKTFGGEDMTAAMAAIIVEKIEQGHPTMRISVDPAAETDPSLIHLADLNRRMLRGQAESIKIYLSKGEQFRKAATNLVPVLRTSAETQSKQDFDGLNLTLAELQSRLERPIDETMQMAEALIESSGVGKVDLVLLVGMASKLPLVQKLAKGRFEPTGATVGMLGELVESLAKAEGQPTTDLVTDVKSCVAYGAGLFGVMANSIGSVSIEPQLNPKTTSRLGFQVADFSGPRFMEVIGLGKPLPASGSFRVGLRPNISITVLENTSTSDEITPEVVAVKTFRLPEAVAARHTPEQLRAATLRLVLTEAEQLLVEIVVPGAATPYQMNAERVASY